MPQANFETFFGFVKDRADAQLLVEACATGLLTPVSQLSVSASSLHMRSGSVIVLKETARTQAQKTRWRDAFSWSSSRISGPFLLYREVESLDALTARNHGQRERSNLFETSSLRSNTRLIPNGLAKRTVTLTADQDGARYRIISYFYPHEVEHLYSKSRRHAGIFKTPSQLPQFEHLKLGPPTISRTPASVGPVSECAHSPALERWTLSPTELAPMPSSQVQTTKDDWMTLLHKFETESCVYAGSGVREASSYFSRYPDWTQYPVTLAPLSALNTL